MGDEAGRPSALWISKVLERIWGFVLGAMGQPQGCFVSLIRRATCSSLRDFVVCLLLSLFYVFLLISERKGRGR